MPDPAAPVPARAPALTRSWRTSVAGIASLVISAAMLVKALADGDPFAGHLNELLAALGFGAAGVQGLVARDSRVSSESAGAK